MEQKESTSVDQEVLDQQASEQQSVSVQPLVIEQAEADAFVMSGRGNMTILAQGGDLMLKWANVFEQRGGVPVYGNDALEIVYLSNDFQAWLTPERKAVINRLRTDV